MLKRFLRDRGGNFAAMTVVAAIPLLLGVGFGLDYARQSSAHNHLQEIVDSTALALAATRGKTEEEMRKLAEDVISANTGRSRLDTVAIAKLITTSDHIDLTLRGDIPATFMGIAGWERLGATAFARAERAVTGAVEVAMVLDNTWSMSDTDDKGVTRIDALKKAATKLVTELMTNDDGVIKIGLVPYADYVNVGTQNRGASWLDVGADYVKPPTSERVCVTKTTKTVCDKKKPSATCTRVVDGIEESYECGGGCEAGYSREEDVKPYQSCSGGGSGTAYKWYGCVGSRMTGETRLNDGSPSVRYPGFLTTSQKCLNPIVDLTTNRSTLLTAIDQMIIQIGSGYRPNTYIPAGLIWGLNMLSPSQPFTAGAAYDTANQKPRKVAVLMTDGENTLRFRASDGAHINFSGNATNLQKQYDAVNADSLAICSEMKKNNIEIFSIAFMVEKESARTMLQSCATDSEHYYDASDSDKLIAAFGEIGASLRVVRLAR